MLTRNFLRNLKTKAQHLHPIVIIGNNGLTPQIHHEVNEGLEAHELIKVRVNAENRDERKRMISEIAETANATIVQAIGHVLVLYRAKEE
jgi:RNA-binding protein